MCTYLLLLIYLYNIFIEKQNIHKNERYKNPLSLKNIFHDTDSIIY